MAKSVTKYLLLLFTYTLSVLMLFIVKVGITRKQSIEENHDNNSTVFTIATPIFLILIVGVIIVVIFVAVCVMRKKQKSRRYLCIR